MHDRRRDGGVDAAGQAADDLRVADLGTDPLDLLGDDVAAVPVAGDAGGAVQEVLEHGLAVRGVLDLGVPLHAVEAALVARERRDGRGRAGGEDLEALGRLRHGVAVAHPHGLVVGLAVEQGAAGRERDRGGSVLAGTRVRDLAAESAGHDLEAVADAEHGDAELEDPLIEAGRALLVDAGRAAAQDDAGRVLRADLLGRDRGRHDLRVDVGLADAAGDQLRVLGAEVDDEDGTLVRGVVDAQVVASVVVVGSMGRRSASSRSSAA